MPAALHPSPLRLEAVHDPDRYGEVLRDLPLSSPLQGWGYGEARRTLGQQPLRYLIRRGGHTVGAVQLLRRVLAPGVSTLYAPRGPALESLDLLPELAGAIRRVARPSDALVRIEPPSPWRESADIAPGYCRWRRAEAEQPEHTILADLTPAPEELFAGLHSMARRNVRAAQKFGVSVERSHDLGEFWPVFTATNERAQLGAFPRGYYQTMLREGNRHGGEAYLILARHEGRPLAGGFFLGLGGLTCYLFGGSVRDDRPGEGGEPRRDVKAPTLFYWGAMQDAREHGYRTLDFWGIPRKLDEEKHSFGIYRMKENFGGARVWYPAYTLGLNPLAGLVARALRGRKTRNNLRKRGNADDVL